MNLGEKIIELRKTNHLTQEFLAEKLKISRQTLANYESNRTSPSILEAKEISKIFKVSLDDLLDINLEITCKKNVLEKLLYQECYLDVDLVDYRFDSSKPVRILEILESFIKIQFSYGKKSITKLLDKSLIKSIKIIEKRED